MAGLIIKPRARILHGHDWVFSGEVLKAFGNPADGDVISLKDGRDRLIGSAIYNSKSQIVARRFSRRKQDLDLDFFQRRITQAVEYRAETRPEPATLSPRLERERRVARCDRRSLWRPRRSANADPRDGHAKAADRRGVTNGQATGASPLQSILNATTHRSGEPKEWNCRAASCWVASGRNGNRDRWSAFSGRSLERTKDRVLSRSVGSLRNRRSPRAGTSACSIASAIRERSRSRAREPERRGNRSGSKRRKYRERPPKRREQQIVGQLDRAGRLSSSCARLRKRKLNSISSFSIRLPLQKPKADCEMRSAVTSNCTFALSNCSHATECSRRSHARIT